MKLDLKNKKIRDSLLKGKFGMEKESLRIDEYGYLAHTRHPFLENKNIERDFCENQTEIVTDVWESLEEAYENLLEIHRNAQEKLLCLDTGAEYFWPFSNPPYIRGEKEVMIANYQGKLKGKEVYREYLAEKYGKKKMLFSGVHFNYSFPEELILESYSDESGKSVDEYRNQCYLELAAKLTEYSWLIVYLTAASPLFDGSYIEDCQRGKTVCLNYASPRCSEIGYWNDFIPLLEYDSLEEYVKSIQNYVESGQLKSPAELYYPVRLKPQGQNTLENLMKTGVNHLEFRLLDLNPYEECGIALKDLKFLHYLIVYLMSKEAEGFYHSKQMSAIKNAKNAAKFMESSICIDQGWNQKMSVKDASLNVLMAMERFFDRYKDEKIMEVLRFQRNKIVSKQARYSERVLRDFEQDFVKLGLEYIKKNSI